MPSPQKKFNVIILSAGCRLVILRDGDIGALCWSLLLAYQALNSRYSQVSTGAEVHVVEHMYNLYFCNHTTLFTAHRAMRKRPTVHRTGYFCYLLDYELLC